MRATFFILACLVALTTAKYWETIEGGKEGDVKVSVPSSFDKATKDCIIARIDEDFTIQGRMIRCKKENPSDGDTKEAIDCFKNLKSLVTCFL